MVGKTKTFLCEIGRYSLLSVGAHNTSASPGLNMYSNNFAKVLLKFLDDLALLGPYCPSGFQHLGRQSDGRTCYGDNTLADGNVTDTTSFHNGSCVSGYDRVRERWTPTTAEEISRYQYFFP